MSKRHYIDFNLIKKYPNKYDLTIEKIKKLVIVDWDSLKQKTWHNKAMEKDGSWWCHLEGCQAEEQQPYKEEDVFWIGFREEDNKVDCYFTSYEGMCGYVFDKFYDASEIENIYDMNVQVNAIKWLNTMIDSGILALQNS